MTRTAPFGFSRVVFLSHVIDAGTPVFPGDPPVESIACAQHGGYLGRAYREGWARILGRFAVAIGGQ